MEMLDCKMATTGYTTEMMGYSLETLDYKEKDNFNKECFHDHIWVERCNQLLILPV